MNLARRAYANALTTASVLAVTACQTGDVNPWANASQNASDDTSSATIGNDTQPTTGMSGTSAGTDGDINDEPAAPEQRVFLVIEDLEGNRIPNAVAVRNRVPRQASSLGQILYEDVKTDLFVASVHAPGFTSASVALDVPEGGRAVKVVKLMSRGAPVGFQAAEGVVLEKDGTRVRIRPNSLIDRAGNLVTGQVDATLVVYDPAVQGVQAMPGVQLALNENNELVNLQTAAMVEVTLTQNGEPVQIAPNHFARLEIILPPDAAGKVKLGDEIEAWWLDEKTGVWMQENSGLIVKSTAKPGELAWAAEVSHFTWWNIDWPWMESRCFDVKLTNSQGKPRANVSGFLSYHGGVHEATSSQSGEFCVEMRLGESATLVIGNPQYPSAEPIQLVSDANDPPSNCVSSLGTKFSKVFFPKQFPQPPGLPCEKLEVKIYDNPVCQPGDYKVCPGYPAEFQNKLGIGICEAGREYCNPWGTGWEPCSEHKTPLPESCASAIPGAGIGFDDDCNGEVDEVNCGSCVWDPPQAKECYPGSIDELGHDLGICKTGQQLCVEFFNTGEWGGCGENTTPPITPQVENCATPNIDENCDGIPICTGFCRAAFEFGDNNEINPTTPHYGSAIGVDSMQNVFTAGEFLGNTANYGQNCPVLQSNDAKNQDIVVAKFLAGQPTCEWTRRIGGIGVQKAEDLVVDKQGNVVVVGFFQGTLDADEYNPVQCPAIASGGDFDLIVAKYNNLGACLGRHNFAGDSAAQQVASVDVDSNDDIYITGSFGGTLFKNTGCQIVGSQTDAFVAKLSGTGVKMGSCLWARRYGDILAQRGKAIAIDDNDDVWFGGDFQGSIAIGNTSLNANNGYDQVFLIKLDGGTAAPLAYKAFNGDATLSSMASISQNGQMDLAITGGFSGTVNVGGADLKSNGSRDIFLARLSQTGGHVWSKSFGGPSVELPADIATDALRNIALVGTLASETNFDGGLRGGAGEYDAFVAKFDSSGKHLWSRGIGDLRSQFAYGVALDPVGTVYMTGKFLGTMDFGIQDNDPLDPQKTIYNNSTYDRMYFGVLEP